MKRASLIVAAVIMVIGAGATPVHAAPERHCVQHLDPAGNGPMRCYASFADAMNASTGVKLDRNATPATMSASDHERLQAQASLSSVYVLAHLYNAQNQAGTPVTFTGGTSCLYTTYAVSNLGGNNNTFESVYMYSSCVGLFYDAAGATPGWAPGGDYTSCGSTCSTFGFMNNRTSSMRFV